MRTWFSRLRLPTLLILAALALLAGCEDDGGPGDGHDFADKNPNIIVALGDSITAGSELSGYPAYPAILAALTGKTVINAGSDGQTSLGGAGRVTGLVDGYKAGYLLVLYGANDVIHGIPRDATIAALRSIISTARSRNTIPVLATLTPAFGPHGYMKGGVDELNFRIRQLAGEEGVALVDLAGAFGDGTELILGDGLHPNETGTERIASSFAGIF